MAVLAVAATACAPLVDVDRTAARVRSSVQAPTVRGGEAVIALDQEPDRLDPTLGTTLAGRQVFGSMCEKLYDVDEHSRVVPQLAAAMPRVSPDGRELTIPLRRGVRFNDGTPFDAAAVKKSLDRHRELPGSQRRTELKAVRSVEVVDPDTVRLRLSEPYSPLPSLLADRAGMIMSPARLDELGEHFSDAPVCVGPFSFVERVAQDRIVLRRSEFYYDRDRVKLDRLVYRAVPDDNIRMANLRSGEFDVAWKVGTPDVPIASREKGIVVLNQPSVQYMGITVNIGNVDGRPGRVPGPLAADSRVRQAFSLAIDRRTLNRIAFNGLYRTACGPIPPNSEFATPKTQECPPHDVAGARRLLAEAGVRTPLHVDLTLQNSVSALRVGQVVQAMAAEAGFDVALHPTEATAEIAAGKKGRFQTMLIGWSGRPDPDGNISGIQTLGGAQNYSGYSTPETDALIKQAAAEADPARRRELYERIVEQLQQRNNVVYLYREQYYTAHTSDIAGVAVFPDGIMRMKTAGHLATGS
ncbi:ABC transporter substrate-binding protein [Saccharopolyspora rosea]